MTVREAIEAAFSLGRMHAQEERAQTTEERREGLNDWAAEEMDTIMEAVLENSIGY